MEKIAMKAGVTRRTVYNQFANVEELYRASREDLILEVAALIPLSVSDNFSPAAALRTYCGLLAEAFADFRSKELYTSILRDGWQMPWFVEAYDRHIRVPVARSLESYIMAVRPNNFFRTADARREAHNMLGTIESIALSASLFPGEAKSLPEVAACTSDYLDGFMARVGRPSNMIAH